jgi:hypothetical protein
MQNERVGARGATFARRIFFSRFSFVFMRNLSGMLDDEEIFLNGVSSDAEADQQEGSNNPNLQRL